MNRTYWSTKPVCETVSVDQFAGMVRLRPDRSTKPA